MSSRTKPKKQQQQQPRALKRKRGEEDLQALEQAVTDFNPKDVTLTSFSDLPLSRPTSSGLEDAHFKNLTDIQAGAIPLALKGADCLGAAKTGSGKTLAFLVPVLDILYRRQWSQQDGLGALILTPTRELAIQIFDVLRKIGRHHTFSAGLVIGGRSLQEERERLDRMNILICTPGRMLQHLDQTAAFNADGLQVLVLDEADRIMDMGFQWQVDAILEHLPVQRQTLLFSATQTKRVSDLARLKLKDPEYIAVHEGAKTATPATLQQHYVVTPLPEKLNTLYSFLRSNVKAKILVFLSSGKQVRFVFESFRRLRPGIPLLHLHGRQKQTARLEITSKFSSAKHSCLFATDVVARGLDFPAVDWVLQLDCPEDAETYIHRVGRTARFERNGRAVLFLDPSEEEGMLKRLEQKKVPIEKIKVREKKQQSIKDQLQNMCFKDPELKYLGQKAFISYTRSIHIQKDKEIFKLDELALEEFAASVGLPGAPKIKFSKGHDPKVLKNASRQRVSSSDEEDSVRGETNGVQANKKKDAVRTKYDRMFERRNQDVLAEHYSKIVQDDDENMDINGDADEDDTFLTVKRRMDADDGEEDMDMRNGESYPKQQRVILPARGGGEPLVIDSKRREKLLKSKKKLLKLKGKGTKLVYDDDGNAHPVYELEDENQFRQRGDPESQRIRFLEEERNRVKAADLSDKQMAKEKKRERREKKKAREAEGRDGEVRVELAPFEDEAEDGLEDMVVERDIPPPEPDEGEETVQRPRKRQKKWFEDDDEDDHDVQETNKRKNKESRRKGASVAFDVHEEPETLEEWEAMASGLLG
ncbi:MAG: ATP-dependent RNA helicase dbp4 [Peltula sp. TS41687]|nr:MAG: ATP-dependent RNA helicase dbp4 [Peltula sp. TS41687]